MTRSVGTSRVAPEYVGMVRGGQHGRMLSAGLRAPVELVDLPDARGRQGREEMP